MRPRKELQAGPGQQLLLSLSDQAGLGERFGNSEATLQRAASTYFEESVPGPAEWEVRKWRWLAGKRRREQGRQGAPCGYVGLGGRGEQVWTSLEILRIAIQAGGRRTG